MAQTIHLILVSPLFVVGASALIALYFGKLTQLVRLPSIIGFMIVGTLIGPSVAPLLSEQMQDKLAFINDIALGFVALSIGIELSFAALRRQGKAIIYIILSESFVTAIVVTLSIGLLTRNWPFALLFGAIAPASAPAGTVAIIQEYRAKGPLTQAMYAVVGFDDGLGVMIFGFASAIAGQLLSHAGLSAQTLLQPLIEIVGSCAIGITLGLVMGVLSSRLSNRSDLLILGFAFVLLIAGLCNALGLSLILANLALGIVVVNTQPSRTAERIGESIQTVMPLLFTLFFLLAGAHLRLSALPALGIIGTVYMVARSAGLIGGAWLGGVIGQADKMISNNIGLGILNQAGVAIGLALYVQRTFSQYGAEGEWISSTIITTVTATSILFGIIGPILTKVALERAGEIPHKTTSS